MMTLGKVPAVTPIWGAPLVTTCHVALLTFIEGAQLGGPTLTTRAQAVRELSVAVAEEGRQ